jgi:basic membrane lipoprotein Med (substrate-binding protein (PBP1-ABC) superfamily)
MTGMNKRLRIRHLSTQKSLVGIVGITIIISLSWLVVMCHYDFFQEAYAQIQNQSVQTSIPDLKSPRVAYLTDGHFSDAGWGAFAYNAGQEIISKYGYEVSFLDNVSISNIETTLKSYAVKDYDIIIAQGYEWGRSCY